MMQHTPAHKPPAQPPNNQDKLHLVGEDALRASLHKLQRNKNQSRDVLGRCAQ